MGGVGKTTLMKVINNQLLKETNKFDVLIWVTVSKEMSIVKLQKDIARKLNVTLSEDEDEITRAGMLSDLLVQKGRFVIILDDVWEKFSLERVGIPETSKGSKLLLTTRSLDVCRCMGCRVINMKPLAEEDAWDLFLKRVGSDILNYPDLKPFFNEIFHQLQFSYNHLKDPKLQRCFLSCALYPEDCETPEVDLISLCIAEGLVEEMGTRQAELDRGRSMLNRLINSCLLETVQIDSVRCLKMHDLVRDMALRITSVRPRFLIKASLGLTKLPDAQEWSEDLEKVSSIENYMLQISSEIMPPKCPILATLLLSDCAIDSIPECFFQKMPQLKILDLSWNPIEELPSSISKLQNLTRLLLHNCACLEEVPSLSKLGALKELDLEATDIKAVPSGMEKLINLKYLNLKWIQNLEEIPTGILSNLSCLQCLLVGEAFIRVKEVIGLRKLEIFEGRYGFDKRINHEWYLEALDRQREGPCEYVIYVGKEISWKRRDFTIVKCIVYSWHGGIHTNQIMLPYNIERLEIRDCHVDCCEDGSWFTPLSHYGFHFLSEINIVKWRKIKN
ncbi:hypothetical protein PTKIN_Ptkin14bG0119000 [Pterospermum kingtungense]